MLEFQNHSWYQLLEPDQALAAIAIARAVAARLRERDRVEAAVSAAAQQTAFPQSVHWQPSDVAQGYAGLAIMCSYLDACLPDEGWDVTGHHCIELAAQAMEGQTHRPMGLFSGLSGLAFASWCLSRGGTRYRRLLAGIDEVLVPQVIAQVHHLSGQRHGVSVGQFDLISGLTGVGTYLLCRREEPGLTAALTAILSCLVELTRQELGLPCWHTPAHLVQDRTMQRYYPYGNLNCGLAHGIPGPLGLLALAQRENMMVEGMTDAINRVADWLARNRLDDTWGINWPTTVPLTLAGTVLVPTNAAAPLGSSRTAWCYGSPGVARALWLAGEALDDSGYRDLAITAMEAVYRRPLAERRIDSPTFCHGVAGLLQVTLRFARDTGRALFIEAARSLSAQILSLYDPDSLLGYCNLESGGRPIDQPGFLDGAAGVALVLLAAATNVEPSWDRLFLLQ